MTREQWDAEMDEVEADFAVIEEYLVAEDAYQDAVADSYAELPGRIARHYPERRAT